MSAAAAADSDDDVRAMLAEKARELFDMCDTDRKGFITKRDMQRLCGPLQLQPEQADAVFDRLDGDADGCLTLLEFSGGFGAFLGVQQAAANPAAPEPAEAEFVHGSHGNRDAGEYRVDEDEHYHQTMAALGASGAFQDEDLVKELWCQLQMKRPELVPGLESLLTKMSSELQKSHTSCQTLERVLRTKSTAHDEEVRRLYEEMEAQIRSERARVLAEERAREKLLREEMERETREKERLCHDLMTKQESLERRLADLNLTQAETAQENERLGQERDALEEELEESREALEESRAYVEELQRKFKDDRRRRAQSSIRLTEGIALERESLVRQLDCLRDDNRRLKDATDIAGGLDGLGRGGGFGEVVHVDSDDAAGQKDFSRQESLQSLMASAAVVAGGETLADIMGGHDDDCEFDDVSGLEFQPLPDGGDYADDVEEAEVEEEVICQSVAAVAYGSAAIRSSECWPPPPGIVRETSETATMVTPCPSRPTTPPPPPPPPPVLCETEIQTEEPLMPPLLLRLPEGDAAESDAIRPELRGSPEGAGDEDFLLGRDSTAELSEPLVINKAPERVFKVVFIGDSGVGKSSVIHRFCQNAFKSTFSATIGIDFQVKSMELEGQVVALQLWDTAGQERFRSITKQYFRKADGVVIVYDVTNAQSYLHLREWLDSVVEGAAGEAAVKMLLGNKADLLAGSGGGGRAVEADSARQLAREYDEAALFFEVSAKSGASVSEALVKFAMQLREKEDRELRHAIRISADIEKKKSCCFIK